MSRISLVEAYDNRDVIGQLVRLREDVNELQNILKDIDPDGDLTNVVTKTGDQVIDGIKTFVGKIVADCDIIQLGGNYETHAEQVYSKNDYIVMRDEAVSGLASGTYSGFQVKKYNGSDDARLVVDNEGVARVGDLNNEQPLLTRDETADLTDGAILAWDATGQKAKTDLGTIGSDTKPLKIVNGEPVPVTYDTIISTGDQSINGMLSIKNALQLNTYTAGTPATARGVIQLPNTTSGQIARLEIISNNDGSMSLRFRKLRISDGSVLQDTEIASFSA